MPAAGLHLVIYSAGLIVVMLYFPGGIAGALDTLTRPEAHTRDRNPENRQRSAAASARCGRCTT